ncbi:MAG: C4-dicarboxylate ABC transporter permease [Clostridiaceae bacterium]|jgi:uncharacterized ion transporter superfamily protein YfcC|nr:C4-dicarboxylate ABC transporter permease [Clostridiaceae bacterium]
MTTMEVKPKKKFKFELPDTIVLLLILTLVAAILTYIIPAGEYDRVLNEATKRQIADPNSYHLVEQKPVGIIEMFDAIPQGLIESANIMILTLICGAVFHLVNFTGAIDAGLGSAIRSLTGKKKYILVFGLYLVSSILGLRGSAETLLPFVPMAVAACIALGYDSIAGTGIILIGGAAGLMNSFMSTTLIIAQGIAELPPFSGLAVRVVSFFLFLIVGGIFIYFYCRKLDKDPKLSPMYDADRSLTFKDENNIPEFTPKRKLVLSTFGIGMITLMACITIFTFNVAKVTTLYFILALIIGVVGGYTPNSFAKEFVNGCKSMMYGALIVGFAKSISVVMTNGMILDTITHFTSGLLDFLPASILSSGMMVVQAFLSVVVPSGSGQAAVTMPIMAPLADFIGVTRQTSVLAFTLGDGIINLLTPTSGYFMAAIGISNISWSKWSKWYMPLCIAWIVLACIILSVCTAMKYGPF